MTGLVQDLHYAARQLRKNPGFAAVAIITLAIGIGANTAIFSAVNALLLKMLPVSNPSQLVVVGDPTVDRDRSNGTPRTDVFSYPLYRELRDKNSVFSGLFAAASDHEIEIEALKDQLSDSKVTGRMVSGNYFTVLGLKPASGRLFTDSDDTAEGANPVVVLGYRYWQSKFEFSPPVIGTSIHLNGYPFTVIGVAPAGFEGDVVGDSMSVFVPLSMQPQILRGRHWRNSGNASWLSLIGRLKSGVTLAHAKANMDLVFRQAIKGDYGAALSADDRNALRDFHINVSTGGGGISGLRGTYQTPLILLMGIVGLVLLIACVNVANLLLARVTTRNKEIAVRLAVGADRRRIFQQLLTESVLLALFGGLAGSLLAIEGVRFLSMLLESDSSLSLSLDTRVLAFTFGVSLLTGVLFGLIPALRTLKVQVSPTLKDATRTIAGSGSRYSWGKGLISGQVALSFLVLFATSLLVRSLQKLMTQDLGFSRDHLVIARLDPAAAGYTPQQMKLLAEELNSKIASTPGIRAASYSTNGLFAHSESSEAILVPGFKASGSGGRVAREDYVGPGYFGAVGIPILAGRGVESRDTESSTRVAVVNQAMVKYFFAGQDPIGRQFRIDDPDWLNKPLTIVGISRDANSRSLRGPIPPRFYMSFQQVPDPFQIVIEAQTQDMPSAVLKNIVSQIKAVDRQIPISFIETLDTLVDENAADHIALARLSSFLAGVALLLACIGLYGVMSYTVASRTREIGLRIALGARSVDVVQMVMRESLFLVIAGIAIGIPLAVTSARLLDSFLFGLKSTDMFSLFAVTLALSSAGLIAGLVPARRAAKVDPMVALRYE